jgi:hypothetical protein
MDISRILQKKLEYITNDVCQKLCITIWAYQDGSRWHDKLTCGI